MIAEILLIYYIGVFFTFVYVYSIKSPEEKLGLLSFSSQTLDDFLTFLIMGIIWPVIWGFVLFQKLKEVLK
ncbi:MAG: hypothetical protein ACOC5T_04020 [Elusimicrobiota bacterium]